MPRRSGYHAGKGGRAARAVPHLLPMEVRAVRDVQPPVAVRAVADLPTAPLPGIDRVNLHAGPCRSGSGAKPAHTARRGRRLSTAAGVWSTAPGRTVASGLLSYRGPVAARPLGLVAPLTAARRARHDMRRRPRALVHVVCAGTAHHVLHATCCTSRVACCPSRVACCMECGAQVAVASCTV
jgi:hypothetical protein